MPSNAGRIAGLITALVVVGVVAAILMLGHQTNFHGSADTPARSAETPAPAGSEVEIAVEDAADPWSNADGTGCANDIVRASFNAANYPVRLNVMPYSRAKVLVMDGQVAACVAMSWSPELEGKIRFPDGDRALYTCTATFVQNLGSPVKAKALSELPVGTKLGTVLKYEYPAGVLALKSRGVQFDDAANEESSLKKLVQGYVDLAVINIDELKSADLLFRKAGVSGAVGVVLESFPQASHIGFSVSHPRGQEALKKYNEGYALIIQNGTLEKIRADWRAKYK